MYEGQGQLEKDLRRVALQHVAAIAERENAVLEQKDQTIDKVRRLGLRVRAPQDEWRRIEE